MLETLFIIHRAKLLLPISPHPWDQQGSPCCLNFLAVTLSYHSKVYLVGALDAKKLAAAVLLYVLWIEFLTPLLRTESLQFFLKFGVFKTIQNAYNKQGVDHIFTSFLITRPYPPYTLNVSVLPCENAKMAWWGKQDGWRRWNCRSRHQGG